MCNIWKIKKDSIVFKMVGIVCNIDRLNIVNSVLSIICKSFYCSL